MDVLGISGSESGHGDLPSRSCSDPGQQIDPGQVVPVLPDCTEYSLQNNKNSFVF